MLNNEAERRQNIIIETFSDFLSIEGVAKELSRMNDRLVPIPEGVESISIADCQSKLEIGCADCGWDDPMFIYGYSDSKLIGGVLSCILYIADGATPEELCDLGDIIILEMDLFPLTPDKTKSLRQCIDYIFEKARSCQENE